MKIRLAAENIRIFLIRKFRIKCSTIYIYSIIRLIDKSKIVNAAATPFYTIKEIIYISVEYIELSILNISQYKNSRQPAKIPFNPN